MFGILRTYLAFWVVIFHLLNIPILGGYAVYGFYMLSGFLMTTIMHNSYGYTLLGIRKYLFNRGLRLFPIYWAVALISILIIIVLGESWTSVYTESFYLPKTPGEIMQNISMVFVSLIPNENTPRLAPPTWALTVEMFFYILIALGISKTEKRVLTWIFISLVYTIFTYVINLDSSYRYFPIYAASLPFSIGSWLFFRKDQIKNLFLGFSWYNPLNNSIIATIHLFIFIILSRIDRFSFLIDFGFYFNLIIFAVLVIPAFYYQELPLISKKTDKNIGDYSYPIYLSHEQMGAISAYILFQEPIKGFSAPSIVSFFFASCLVFAFSKLLIEVIDKPINSFRKKVKRSLRSS